MALPILQGVACLVFFEMEFHSAVQAGPWPQGSLQAQTANDNTTTNRSLGICAF